MTLRIVFVARYGQATMDRKVALMAEQPGVAVAQVTPRFWQGEMLRSDQQSAAVAWRKVAVPMLGRLDDPHRTVYRTFFTELRGFDPDVVHVEEEPDSLAALQVAGARSLWWRRARLVLSTWQNLDRRMGLHVRAVRSLTLAAADAVLCASTEAEELLRAKGYHRPIAVIPAVGVDTTVFKPDPSARTGSETFQFGYVGRLVPEKAIDLPIRALRFLPAGARLIVIGDGPERESLLALAGELGVAERVEFAGGMAPAQVALRLPSLDALVLPSIATSVWKEQFGRVLVEAMACGVPVVGSDSGAIPEVIGDAGLVFPAGAAEALASALSHLQASRELRADLSVRGIARVRERFTQERIAQQTLDFYRQILGYGQSHA